MTSPLLLSTLLLLACGDKEDPGDTGPQHSDGGSSDGGAADGGSSVGGAEDGGSSDGGGADGGSSDGGAEDGGSSDGGSADGGSEDVPLPGWGEISGDCGVLDDDEWGSSDPFLFRNSIDFGATDFDKALLTEDGQEVIEDGNLNGSSLNSEAIAMELMGRCELAALLKTEAEIIYDNPEGKKTDLLVWLDERQVGVSVTRAYHYPPEEPYTVDDATNLLSDKLGDIPISADNASDEDEWERSVLHVIAYDGSYADSIETAWAGLDASVRDRTIVVVTVTEGNDDFVY